MGFIRRMWDAFVWRHVYTDFEGADYFEHRFTGEREVQPAESGRLDYEWIRDNWGWRV